MRDESYNNPILREIKRRFSILNPQYGNIPLKEGHESYTDNKTAITLCLKDPETDKYYDMNSIMYVSLHELSHIITKSYEDHGTDFKKNFRMLLDLADQKGIYDSNRPILRTYCGVS